jgi:hypothetical protein
MTNRGREIVADRDFRYSGQKIWRRLAEVLGLGYAEIKFLTKSLVEGEHYKKNGRSEVLMTATGVRLLCRGCDNPPDFLIVGDCDVNAPKKENGAAPVYALPAPPIKLRVMRKLFNPRVLDATDPSGHVCHVIVGDSQKYAYGAEFTACPSTRHKGFYEVVSPPPFNRWTT